MKINFLKKIILFSGLFCIFSIHALLCLDKSDSTNLQIIDAVVEKNIESVTNFIKSRIADSLFISGISGDDGQYYQLKLSNGLTSAGIKMFGLVAGDFRTPRLEPVIEIRTEYLNAESDKDLLLRKIQIKISGLLTTKNGSIESIPSIQTEKMDLIPRDKVDYFNGNKPYSKAIPPEQPSSLWQDIVQPLVIVGTAVITVGLLFTVRSK